MADDEIYLSIAPLDVTKPLSRPDDGAPLTKTLIVRVSQVSDVEYLKAETSKKK